MSCGAWRWRRGVGDEGWAVCVEVCQRMEGEVRREGEGIWGGFKTPNHWLIHMA